MVRGHGLVVSLTATSSATDFTDLASRAYFAADPDVGSLLRQNPRLRASFDFPVGPISDIDSRTVTARDAEQAVIDALFGLVRDGAEAVIADDQLSLTLAVADLADAPAAHAPAVKVLAAVANIWAQLTKSTQLRVALEVGSRGLGSLRTFDALVRSRERQRAALGLVRPPLGAARRLRVHETIDAQAGSFRVEGRRFRAQGGWRTTSGSRSVMYARWDFHDQFTTSGARISTIGASPSSDDDASARASAQNAFDPILNTIGIGSNWIGRNRSGGEVSTNVDALGQFPLGSTETAPTDLFDAYARLHDIEYWVSTHYPKGTEVRVRSPDGGWEYFVSDGQPGPANLRVALHAVWALGPIGLVQSLVTKNYVGRRTPQTSSFVDIDELRTKLATEAKSAPLDAPGGSRRRVTITKTKDGTTITASESTDHYSIQLDGAALSRAVAEYDRTGKWELEKWYGATNDRARGAPPSFRPAGSGAGPGPGPRTIGPGGVFLQPQLSLTLDRSGWVEAAASTVAHEMADGRRSGTVVVDGRKLVVERARLTPTVANGSSDPPRWGAGRLLLHQTDAVLSDAEGSLPLERFHDSSAEPDSSTPGGWSWLPFELLREEGSAGTVLVLVDREADRAARYAAPSPGASGRLVSKTPDDAPVLELLADGRYVAHFARGDRATFDGGGRLRSFGQGQRLVEYRFDGQRLATIVAGAKTIRFRSGRDGRIQQATLSDECAVRYGYDATGYLSAVRLDGESLAVEHDPAGRVVGLVASPEDERLLRAAFDERGRLVRYETPGGSWTLKYEPLQGGSERVLSTDDALRTTQFYFNPSGRLLAYGPAADRLTLINRAPDGSVQQLASGALVAQPSSSSAATFRVGSVLIPLRKDTMVADAPPS